MIIPRFELKFRTLEKGENLYDKANLDRYTVVKAEYLYRPGFEHNPDVCAIPKSPSATDVLANSSVNMIGYDRSKVGDLKKHEKIEAIEELDHVMTPLGIHLDVAAAINALIVKSYKARDVVVTEAEGDGTIQKQGFACNVLSLRKDTAPRPMGFFLYGKTGSGKSMSVQLACRMYPKAIVHELDGITYTQIPIIYVTALKRQTSDVFRSIAARIDEILGTGDYHESKVRSGTLTKSEGYIKSFLKQYHVSLLIIDEVQFLAHDKRAKSIEDIIGITQETGCNFGFIGNEDAMEKICEIPRILGRVERYMINADKFTTNGSTLFEFAMKSLWKYQWTISESELTDDIRDYLMYETTMNIALLKYILIKVQSEAVVEGRKKPIDVDYIKKKTNADIKKLRELIADPTDREEREYTEYMRALRARLASYAADERESGRGEIIAAIERGKLHDIKAATIDRVVQSVSDTTGFSESNIRRAVFNILEHEPSLIDYPPKILATKVREVLEGIEKKNEKKKIVKPNKVTNAKEKDEMTKKAMKELGLLKGDNKKE